MGQIFLFQWIGIDNMYDSTPSIQQNIARQFLEHLFASIRIRCRLHVKSNDRLCLSTSRAVLPNSSGRDKAYRARVQTKILLRYPVMHTLRYILLSTTQFWESFMCKSRCLPLVFSKWVLKNHVSGNEQRWRSTLKKRAQKNQTAINFEGASATTLRKGNPITLQKNKFSEI